VKRWHHQKQAFVHDDRADLFVQELADLCRHYQMSFDFGGPHRTFVVHYEADGLERNLQQLGTATISGVAGPQHCDLPTQIGWDPVHAPEIDGRLIPRAEFIVMCEQHDILDYDGNGELATAGQVSGVEIDVDKIADGTFEWPAWATHVCWFNR
jgi:hypothetical protein